MTVCGGEIRFDNRVWGDGGLTAAEESLKHPEAEALDARKSFKHRDAQISTRPKLHPLDQCHVGAGTLVTTARNSLDQFLSGLTTRGREIDR